MHINRELNLVIPLEREDGGILYIHLTPLRYEIFEQYYLIIAKTFNKLYAEGLREMGARVAYLMLKDVATEMGKWGEIENGLIGEFMRTSTALVLSDTGWQSMPMGSAIGAKLISEEEVRDFKGYAVFFSCVWSMHTPAMRAVTLDVMARLWGLLTTLSDCTAFKTLLTTSTKNGLIGESSEAPATQSLAS